MKYGIFANGAVTAAMAFSFGQLAQRSAAGNGQADQLSLSDDELDALIRAGGSRSSGCPRSSRVLPFSALAFYNVGQVIAAAPWARGGFGGTDLSAAGLAAKTVSHGLIGGAIADLPGGRFGHGFLSSGVTAASSPYIPGGFGGNRFAQGALASIIGGTVSKSTGGKFANGAATAAMAFAFNQVASQERRDRGVCSDEACVGKARISIEPRQTSRRRPVYEGVESIESHRWVDVTPPTSKRLIEILFNARQTGVFFAHERGRFEYEFIKRTQLIQYRDSIHSGFERYRLPGTIENGETFWRPLEIDSATFTRPVFKSCLVGACLYDKRMPATILP